MNSLNSLLYRTGSDTRLITCEPSHLFYVGSLIWNVVSVLLKIEDFSLKQGPAKLELKKEILKIQAEEDPME